MSTEALHHKITDGQNKVDSMNLDGSSSDMDDEEFFDPDEEGVTFEKSFDSNDGNNIERLLTLQAAVTNHSHNRPGARCPVPDGMPLIKSGDQVSAGLGLHRWRLCPVHRRLTWSSSASPEYITALCTISTEDNAHDR